jgi:hypothetical protein
MKLSEKKRAAPGIKPVYTVNELATITGMSRFAVLRLLRRHNVPTITAGNRILLVPVVGFRLAFPDLWESMVWVQSMRS